MASNTPWKHRARSFFRTFWLGLGMVLLAGGSMPGGAGELPGWPSLDDGARVPTVRPFEWWCLRGPSPLATPTAKPVETTPAETGFRLTGSMEATAQVGTEFSWTARVAGGTATSFTAQGLPDGLSMDASHGTVSGTPTKAGTYEASVLVYGEDDAVATGQLLIRVEDGPMVPRAAGMMASAASVLVLPGTPTFLPDSSTHYDNVSVTLSCLDAATIRYTTDGTEPSLTNGTAVTPGQAVTLTSSCTLQAKGFTTGGREGTMKSSGYTILKRSAATALTNGVAVTGNASTSDLNLYYFEVPAAATNVAVEVVGSTTHDTLDLYVAVPPASAYPTTNATATHTSMNDVGTERVEFTNTFGGGRVYITVLSLDVYSGAVPTFQITARYNVAPPTPGTPTALYRGATISGDTTAGPQYYYLDVPVDVSGSVYINTTTSVSGNILDLLMNVGPANTALYPANDTSGSYQYYSRSSSSGTEGYTFSRTTVVGQRIFITVYPKNATPRGAYNITATYTLNTPSTPSFSPAGGTYANSIGVRITCSNAKTIRYTTNGDEPTATTGTQILPGQTVTLTSSCRMRARGFTGKGAGGSSDYWDYKIGKVSEPQPLTSGVAVSGDVAKYGLSLYYLDVPASAETITIETTGSSTTDTLDLYVNAPHYEGYYQYDRQVGGSYMPGSTGGGGYDGSYYSSGNSGNERIVPLNWFGGGRLYITVQSKTINSDDTAYTLKASYTTTTSIPGTPVLAPNGGTFTGSVTVTLSAPNASSLRYITGGGQFLAYNSGTVITPGGTITLSNSSTTLRVRAFNAQGVGGPVSTATYTVLPMPGTPTFSPDGGSHNSTVNVTIGCANTSTIRYTIDGTEPTPTTGLVMAPGQSVALTGSCVLKAIGINSAGVAGPVKTASYSITASAALPVFSPDGGSFSDSLAVTITSAGASVIRYTLNNTEPSATNGTALASGQTVTLTSACTLKAVGVNSAGAAGPVKTAVYTLAVAPPAPTFSMAGGTYANSVAIAITAPNAAYIGYTTDGTTPSMINGTLIASGDVVTLTSSCTLNAVAFNTAGVAGPVQSAVYTINLPTPTLPVFSPDGGTHTGSVVVTLTCSGASSIRYTTNGTTPTATTGILLTSGQTVTLTGTSTLKAVGVSSQGVAGSVKTATYTIVAVPATPTFSPDGGSHSGSVVVTLNCANASTIRYTCTAMRRSISNGNAAASIATTGTIIAPGGKITVAASQIIEAVGVNSLGVAGPVKSATFTILSAPPATNPSAPTFSRTGGTYPNAVAVVVQCANAQTIRYTTDGSAPSATKGTAATPGQSISINQSAILRAVGVNASGVAGPETNAYFEIGQTVESSGGWRVAAVGDFNGDGKSDVLHRHDVTGKTRIFFMNKTTVTAQTNTSKSVDASWRVAAVADFNGDNKDDILWRNTAGKTYIWFMNGASVLASSAYTTKTVGNDWTVQGVGRFNNDNYADILWRNAAGQTYLWFMNGKTVLAASAYTSKTVGTDWTVQGVGDFNHDGFDDILWRHANGKTYLWFMNGKTVLPASAYTSKTVGPDWTVLGVGHFNSDGHADVLWRNAAGKTYVWYMDGHQVSSASAETKDTHGNAWAFARLGDFNGDGTADLLWTHTLSQLLDITLMNGTNVQTGSGAPSAQMAPEWRVVGRGDFNNDGHDDLLWRNGAGKTYLWFMNGSTVLATSDYTSKFVGADWTVVGVGNFDGQYGDDILWRNTAGKTYLWRMNGKNVLASSAYTSSSVGYNWTVAGVGDFNGDGKDDVLWRHADGRTYLWFMNGATVLATSAYTSKAVDHGWTVAGIGRFNNDNRDDILWRNAAGKTYLWFMDGKTVTASSGYTGKSVGLDWTVQGVADMDGDGQADILWRNTAGKTYLWLMNGLSIKKEGYTGNQAGTEWQGMGVGRGGASRGTVFWRNASTNQSYVWTQNGLATTHAALTTKQVK